jgi:hypothetical protein
VHVAAPWGTVARSRGFVRLRRTVRPMSTTATDRLRYVAAAPAIIAATRTMRTERQVLAVMSDALQRHVVTHHELMTAHVQGPPKNARLADAVLRELCSNVRSAPEADFRRLAEASLVLPPLLYNCLLRLPDGRLISPDAMAVDAGLVHEVNGRSAHERADLFEDMQERHDAMTAAGLTVLHNPPRRVQACGRVVISEMERCYVRLAGRGLPPGVVLVRRAA